MVKLNKYNINGVDAGTAEIDLTSLEALYARSKEVDPKGVRYLQSIKDYIVAIRANARQYSAHTKRRMDSHHTGKKPHPQKGQGRSRQGDLAAPHYKGGAVVWGPRTKDIYTRINQKERQSAIRFLIAEKIAANQVCVLAKTEMEKPKTKVMVDFLAGAGMAQFINRGSDVKEPRVLVLGAKAKDENSISIAKSLRNLDKREFMAVQQVNGYELVKAHRIVVLESALKEFAQFLGTEEQGE